jgi:transposase-like protein
MSRPETVELWRQRLQRFDSARMTVARFCQSEGVSQPSFYKWKKTLRELSQQPSLRPTQPEVSFVPLRVSAAAENRVEVATDHAEHEPVAPPLASTTIELPGGVRIRVEVPTELASGRSGGDQS